MSHVTSHAQNLEFESFESHADTCVHIINIYIKNCNDELYDHLLSLGID